MGIGDNYLFAKVFFDYFFPCVLNIYYHNVIITIMIYTKSSVSIQSARILFSKSVFVCNKHMVGIYEIPSFIVIIFTKHI